MDGMTFTRLRWRLRGAWMWPAFFAITALDVVTLALLPVAGSDGIDVVPALLIAGFFNLVAIAVVAPMLGLVVRRRRRDLPREVARDYAGTALILGVAVALLVGGLIHRPAVLEAERDQRAATRALHDYVVSQAGPTYQARLGTVSLFETDEDDLYRGCVPSEEVNRSLCVFIDTSTDPPGVTRDPSRAGNDVTFGPSPR